MSEEINKLIECLKDNIPVDYTRSCDSSDGIGHYDEDEDSWQYQLYNYITNLQQENQQLKKANEILKENAIHNDKVVDDTNWKIKQYKSVLDEIRECIKELDDNTDDTTCYDIDRNVRDDLLKILDKAGKNESKRNV